MIWFLWILISLGVGLVIFSFFLPEGSRQGIPKVSFQEKTEAALSQLADRVFYLEGESRSANQLCLSIKKDLSDLKEKDLSSIISLLEGREAFEQRGGLSDQASLKFQEYERTIKILREEVEELSHKLIELALEIKRLEEEGEKKERLISELKLRLKKVIKELSDTKTRELKLRADLFKEKAIYSDSEKEIARLARENEELKDGLSYELHN